MKRPFNLAAACLVLTMINMALASAADPFIEKNDLFNISDGRYKIYHIPGIVVTAKGTVLAWCEARKNGGDWDDIRVLLRRSTDDGKTFSEPTIISHVSGTIEKNPFALGVKGVRKDDVTYNNPVLIADRDGTVHMLFCVEYMRCFYQRSTDEGITWSEPVEITKTFDAFKKSYDFKVLATGPDHSIQLKNGRLIVPVWLSLGTGGNAHRPSVTGVIYSDDAGKTWNAGDIAVPDASPYKNPNETVAIELADGSVMLNLRSESVANRRLVTVSKDGATGWSTAKFDATLNEPICMAGIVRYSLAPASSKNRILFSNPDNLERADGAAKPGQSRDRKNLSVKLSYDEGQTWAVNKVVEPGYSGYSDIAVTKSGTILCFYGRGEKKDMGGWAFRALTLARFNIEWLTDGKDKGQ